MHINELVVRKLFYGYTQGVECNHVPEDDIIGIYCEPLSEEIFTDNSEIGVDETPQTV